MILEAFKIDDYPVYKGDKRMALLDFIAYCIKTGHFFSCGFPEDERFIQFSSSEIYSRPETFLTTRSFWSEEEVENTRLLLNRIGFFMCLMDAHVSSAYQSTLERRVRYIRLSLNPICITAATDFLNKLIVLSVQRINKQFFEQLIDVIQKHIPATIALLSDYRRQGYENAEAQKLLANASYVVAQCGVIGLP